MRRQLFHRHYPAIKEQYSGRAYPIYRLLFHISQTTAHLLPSWGGVCSEITADFLRRCEFWTWHKGATPDNIKDWLCDPWQVHITCPFIGWVGYNPYQAKVYPDKPWPRC